MTGAPEAEPRITGLSAVTLATRDMAAAVAFYTALGFPIVHGGPDAPFTSLGAGTQFLNLDGTADTSAPPRGWGRAIFYVSDVDAMFERVRARGYRPEFAPRDAPWGERYFHVRDPDGHEISFARPL